MSSSSRIFFSTATVAGLASTIASYSTGTTGTTTYKMIKNYNHTNFFDEFEFFTEPDPTHGYVEYVGPEIAKKNGYAKCVDGYIYLGADHVTVNPKNGRMSTRLESKQNFTRSLIIGDIAHMPSGPGIWPAFWSFGKEWPNSGEIDIIEGVNLDVTNHVALHTGPGCTIINTGSAKTTVLEHDDCHYREGRQGCGQFTQAPFGTAFNAISGGVYALDWTADYIAMYFFPRDSIPADISNEVPDPGTWEAPIAKFNGGSGCDIGSHFNEHNLVFNTDFCGDWAGSVWKWDKNLTSMAKECVDFVGANPHLYSKAYWLISSVKVYETVNKETPKTYPTGGYFTGVSPTNIALAVYNFTASGPRRAWLGVG
ncbi:putative endo-1 3(4)-beta-glucanase [Ceratocystis platani]|uniref:endo-1,3(4)-beta-glucanase n=1 Tax=Ceratocystis fimbriata f. sp. platani TaxID=88771 RepID=A0A0F8B0A5_CERFI|nr:putative endo-1 3(4)-beta-glucanase [Ceratocystis platani]